MKNKLRTKFIPMLAIPKGTINIDFYKDAFGATVLKRLNNDDDSVRVAELKINDATFHLHEENLPAQTFSPIACNGITTIIGLLVDDVDKVIKHSLKAGARLISDAADLEYGYRQGEIADPFGHHWLIEKSI
jgi:PhnB protein